jgi:hypothetical protein
VRPVMARYCALLAVNFVGGNFSVEIAYEAAHQMQVPYRDEFTDRKSRDYPFVWLISHNAPTKYSLVNASSKRFIPDTANEIERDLRCLNVLGIYLNFMEKTPYSIHINGGDASGLRKNIHSICAEQAINVIHNISIRRFPCGWGHYPEIISKNVGGRFSMIPQRNIYARFNLPITPSDVLIWGEQDRYYRSTILVGNANCQSVGCMSGIGTGFGCSPQSGGGDPEPCGENGEQSSKYSKQSAAIFLVNSARQAEPQSDREMREAQERFFDKGDVLFKLFIGQRIYARVCN